MDDELNQSANISICDYLKKPFAKIKANQYTPFSVIKIVYSLFKF